MLFRNTESFAESHEKGLFTVNAATSLKDLEVNVKFYMRSRNQCAENIQRTTSEMLSLKLALSRGKSEWFIPLYNTLVRKYLQYCLQACFCPLKGRCLPWTGAVDTNRSWKRAKGRSGISHLWRLCDPGTFSWKSACRGDPVNTVKASSGLMGFGADDYLQQDL